MRSNLLWAGGWVTMGVLTAFAVVMPRTPSLQNLRESYRSTDRAVLDRNGQILDEIQVAGGGRRLFWVNYEDLSPAFIEVLGASGSISRALELSALIENVEPPATSLFRKTFTYTSRAAVLTFVWSRHDIIEALANLAFYRGELQGIAAASYSLFDKSPAALTRSESAVLLALTRSPWSEVPNVRLRACALLASVQDQEECALLNPEHLARVEESYEMSPFVHQARELAKRLIHGTVGEDVVRSTLDRQIQSDVHQLLEKQFNGAALVLENSTGHVLAYVGDVSDLHPAGSTLEPFLYAKAMDERILTRSSFVEDSPLGLEQLAGFGPSHRRGVTVKNALTAGLEIPAMRTLQMLGVDSFVHVLKDLGLQNLERPEAYGPSLALGTAEVNLLEMTNAYRALAHGGVWSPVRFSPDESSAAAPVRVVSEAAAFLISDILASSPHCGENWCLGYSQEYTVGVWTRTGFGANALWHDVMKRMGQTEFAGEPAPPESVKQVGGEWFIVGTEPRAADSKVASGVRSRISYPLDRSTLAWNGDIARADHRMFIQIVAPQSDQNVYLNGHRLGRARALQSWDAQTGKYRLELRDSQGQVVDRVRFEVRGSSFAINL